MRFVDTLREEARLIFSDVAIILTIIGGVILYSFLYPQPYANQSISKLNISIVDQDDSDMSRDISFKLNATPQIAITRYDTSIDNAQEALMRGR